MRSKPPIPSPSQIRPNPHTCLRLDSTPLHALSRVLLALLLQKLALLFRTQSAQLGIPLLLLHLVCCQLPFLGLFLIFRLADLGNLLIACLLDAAESFRTEVSRRGELIGEAEEVLKDREGSGVVCGKLQGKAEALAGLGFVETGGC